MRNAMLLILGVIVTGCAASKPAITNESAPAYGYAERPSAAIVFGAPIAMNEPPIDLDREVRQPSVFLGYDEVDTTYFDIRNDDWQIDPHNGRTFRRAITERVGVSYR